MIDSKNDVNGQELHVLKLQLGEPAMVVKSASVEEQNGIKELDSRHFADPASRAFPIHTKSATERSIVYFFGNLYNSTYDSAYPAGHTEDRLKKAARFWNTTDTFYSVKRAYVESNQVCEAVLNYALPNNRLPINDQDQVLKSAAALVAQRHNVAFPMRAEAALKILKAAAEMDVNDQSLDAYVHDLQKIAGLCVRDRDDIAERLESRGQHFELAGIEADIYKSAAASIRTCEDQDIDQLCGLLDAFEHTTKAARVRISPIEDVFYNELPENDTIRLSNGVCIKSADVRKAGLAPFYALGEAVPLRVSGSDGKLDIVKAASFLEYVPKTDAELFYEAVQKCLK